MFGKKQDPEDRVQDVMSMMEEAPLQAYWGAALISIALSAVLYLFGKRSAAIFVGQWPPTFILLSLFYRLLNPSDEDARKRMQKSMKRAKAAAR